MADDHSEVEDVPLCCEFNRETGFTVPPSTKAGEISDLNCTSGRSFNVLSCLLSVPFGGRHIGEEVTRALPEEENAQHWLTTVTTQTEEEQHIQGPVPFLPCHPLKSVVGDFL